MSVAEGGAVRGPNPREGIHRAKLRVGVSARRSQPRPRSCRGVREGVICGDGGHRIFIDRYIQYMKSSLLAVICGISRNLMLVEIVTNYKAELF